MSDWKQSGETRRSTATEEEVETSSRLIPPYHVVLLDDDDHTFEYVIHMLQTLFGFPPEKGRRHADEVNATGRSIVCTTSKERAELKRDQIHAFGPDLRLERSQGSMSSIIEPAEG
ncbi:ATP-dependent Clp protease adaptor ClpS [bacterium]|nr:ATP-dependent Clp protease adaptor ClpS [bacterium]